MCFASHVHATSWLVIICVVYVYVSLQTVSQLLSESLREEMREKNSLIVSMSEQLKNLQVLCECTYHIAPNIRGA